MELRPEIIIDNVDIIETPNYPKINQNEFFIINKEDKKLSIPIKRKLNDNIPENNNKKACFFKN